MSSEESSKFSQSSDGSDYEDIAPYFSAKKFDGMPPLQKLSYRNQKIRYEKSLKSGVVRISMPKFMQDHLKGKDKENQSSNKGGKKRKSTNTTEKSAKQRKLEDDSSPSQRVLRDRAQLSSVAQPQSNCAAVGETSKEDAEINDREFSAVKIYFTPSEWGALPLLSKRLACMAMENYLNDLQKGLTPTLPKFMASRQASSAVTSSSSSGSHPTTSETTTQEYNPIKNFPSTPKLPNKKKAAESLGTSVAVVKDIVKSSEKGSHSTTNDMETQNNEKNSFDLLFSEDLEIGKDIWSEDVDKGKDILSEDDDKDKDEVTYDGSGERLETQDDQMDLNRTWEMTNINPAQNEELIQAITGIIKGASSIVPESTCKDIANHLVVNIALEDVSDLAIVEPAWLSTFNLKPGPLKKIMIAFSGEDKKQPEKPKEKPNVKKGKDKSLMRTQPALDNPIPSRPALSDKISTTDVKKMGFDFPIAWGNMKNSLLTSLEKEQVPSKEDRESMVLTISKDLMAAYEALKKRDPSVTQKHLGRPRYKEIVRVIFKDFKKCFQDTLNEEVVGDGDFTLIDQIETCVENIYRTSSVNKSNATERAKGLRAASCILPHKYCPPMTKAEKKAAEETRLQLLILFKGPKSEWDWNNIKSKLLASLPAQRAILTSPKRTIDDVTEKWPFLFEYQGSLCHLNAITGVDVLENFQDFVKDKLDDLISYLTLESPQRKKNVKINRAVVMVPEAQHTLLLAAVKMLVNHFDENLSDILLTAEETLLPHEVADELADLPATPCIVALEDSPFKAKTFYLCVEKTCINASLTNGLEALVALCAVFFNFGLLYPPKASTTMSYIESQMANLCDGKGIRKAQTEGGIVSRLAYTKLKELVNSVEEHSKEMLGDD